MVEANKANKTTRLYAVGQERQVVGTKAISCIWVSQTSDGGSWRERRSFECDGNGNRQDDDTSAGKQRPIRLLVAF